MLSSLACALVPAIYLAPSPPHLSLYRPVQGMSNSGVATLAATAEGKQLNGKAEMEPPVAAVPEGTGKCKKKKKRKQEVANAEENGMVGQKAAVLEGAAKCKKKKRKQEVANAEENGMVEQEAASATAAVLALEGTPKSKKKKEVKAKEGMMAEQEASTTSGSALEGMPQSKKKKEAKAKEGMMAEQEATTTSVSALEGTPKSKKEAKTKEGVMEGHEVATTLVSALEGMPKSKKKKEAKTKKGVMAGQEAATTSVSALDETPKCKKEKVKEKTKAKERSMVEHGVTTYAVSGAPKCSKEKAKERGIAEQEDTITAVLALEGTLKCKKKEKTKETVVDEPERSTAISALDGNEKYKIKEKGNATDLAKQKTTAAVSASEGTKICKRRKLRKKNKMQEQQESAQALSGLVTEDIIVANKLGNGGTNGEGASGDADVSMDPINVDDPNCSKAKDANDSGDADVRMDPINVDDPNFTEAKDANDKVKCESQDGNMNCSENFSSLQEGSEDRKRQRKREKRKTKRDASNRGRDISLQDGGTVAKPCLDSSMDHDLSCTRASCSIQPHKEKVKNIYSPRGSLIKFQRKKLLILDLNGLLADINMDKQNEHMAHAKVKGKLVFRRPYYDDFLSFCFQNFELGIWSSRKKENVNSIVDILLRDLKQYLLFCWDMSKCTFTGHKVVGDKHKPLVLKELKKLWNKEDPNLPWEQGEFSPSNTLLVDDSPYKALCNPPHTAIFPQSYSYLNQKDDYSLGPGGDLRVYLERLAAADDVQVFVRDNPFGQPSITESDPKWNFYAKIVYSVEQRLSLKWT